MAGTSKRASIIQFYKTLTNDIIPNNDKQQPIAKKSDLISTSITDTIPVRLSDSTKNEDTLNKQAGKGHAKGTYTKQDEMFVYAERIKKVDTSSFFAYQARITNCNLDTPHFAFVSKKIKFINKKYAITGPVHPEFEGVPVPII